MSHIVKVQRPLAGSPRSAGEPDIMVYAQGHKNQVLLNLEHLPPWLQEDLKVSPKVFAEAQWYLQGGWKFIRSAKWQNW
jgi:hypothetical protein